MSAPPPAMNPGAAGANPAKRPRMQEGPGGGGGAPAQPSALEGLRSLNLLSYSMNPDLSVTVSSTYHNHYASQPSYQPSQTMLLTVNSGSAFVSPKDSYLCYDVTNSSDTVTMDFGWGSAINVFSGVVLTSRSGEEIERISRINLLAPILDRYQRSQDWIDTVGGACGYRSSVPIALPADDYNKIPPKTTRRYTVPLSSLCGLFRTFDRLLPSVLMGGLRFTFEINNVKAASAGGSEFSISNVVMSLFSHSLSDAMQRAVLEASAFLSPTSAPSISTSPTQCALSLSLSLGKCIFGPGDKF